MQSADKGVIIVCHERERNKKSEIPAGFETYDLTNTWRAFYLLHD